MVWSCQRKVVDANRGNRSSLCRALYGTRFVSIRETQQGDQTRWTFTTVGRNRLKSAPAKVVRKNGRYSIMGVAWGGLPALAVEVQINNGPWLSATWLPAPLDQKSVSRDRWLTPHGDSDRWGREDKGIRPYAWKFWTLDWGAAPSGEHQIRSRAIDVRAMCSPRRTTHSSRAEEPTGKATAR